MALGLWKFLQSGIDFRGVEEIVNRLVGPKSLLSDLLDENNQLSKELVEIIKDLLTPQRSPDMGKVEQFIQDIIQKVCNCAVIFIHLTENDT